MTVSKIMEHMLDIAFTAESDIPETPRRYVMFSLLDWIVATRAGIGQDLSTIIRQLVLDEEGKPVATLAGAAQKVPARAAALANGTISHALDYDDTHFAHVGHPSVAIYPAALAAGEEVDASARDVCDAFLLGAEASCRIGMVLGRNHYQRGFHQTATAGAFGATIAAGRLYGLTRRQMQHALSLVATQASGLKSQFGSMGKPYNAGLSAANGVGAAKLALRGFESCDDGIAGVQGFIATHSDSPDPERPFAIMPPQQFIFEDIKYKFHACCHGTHAMIEALQQLLGQRGPTNAAVSRITVSTNPRWLKVCDITHPRTGLEVKFSYRYLAAMVLAGIDTASDLAYRDAMCEDQKLQQLALQVDVVPDESHSDTASKVRIMWDDGTTSEALHDLSLRSPLDELEQRLRQKAASLLGRAVADRVWTTVSNVGSLKASDIGLAVNA